MSQSSENKLFQNQLSQQVMTFTPAFQSSPCHQRLIGGYLLLLINAFALLRLTRAKSLSGQSTLQLVDYLAKSLLEAKVTGPAFIAMTQEV